MPSLVILGDGPAGNTCASVAATLGADVTLIERDIVGGAAHLWDCIPSKALIATGGELVELDRAQTMGLSAEGRLDIDAGCGEGLAGNAEIGSGNLALAGRLRQRNCAP